MEDQDLILIGAKHSTAGQFSREFTECQWLAAAREIQAAERERCIEACRREYLEDPQPTDCIAAILRV